MFLLIETKLHQFSRFVLIVLNILLRGRLRNMFQKKQEYILSELQSNLIGLALIAHYK